MEEKKIYLLLTDTGTLFSRLIKCYTKKPYNHASIAFDGELATVYSFGRKKPRNPFLCGFVKEDMLSDWFIRANCAIYSLTVTDAQINQMRSYIRELEIQKELYRYNLLGVFGVMFNKPIERKNAFFCSQFVASVLKHCNVIDFTKDVSLIKPHELPYTAAFQLVYEGKLMAYGMGDLAGEKGAPSVLQGFEVPTT
ncbi:hypothetical protein [Caldibacillus thermoamylovorans]|uniref:hypothetical protein n=1 Tax=Caldibacillus thermoamylovorans TaxID=35841 RepID=UPI0022E9616A|nr:hypothetical protein [Caldibacillus thermoamylovorans]